MLKLLGRALPGGIALGPVAFGADAQENQRAKLAKPDSLRTAIEGFASMRDPIDAGAYGGNLERRDGDGDLRQGWRPDMGGC